MPTRSALRVSFEYKYPDLMRMEFRMARSRKPNRNRLPRTIWLARLPATLVSTVLAPKSAYEGKVSNEYEGRISVTLIKLEQTKFTVGYSKEIRLGADKEGSGYPLAEGIFDVNIDLTDFRELKKVVRTLGYESAMFKRYTRDKAVVEYAQKLTKDWKPKEPEDKRSKKLLAAIAKKMLEATSRKRGNEEVEGSSLSGYVNTLGHVMENVDRDGRMLRSFQHSSMRDEVRIRPPFRKRTPKGFDYEAAKQFGEDMFYIFRYYMNFVIRYLKHNYYQYWLKEIPESDLGNFYLDQKVSYEHSVFLGLRRYEGIMIPTAFHFANIPLIRDDFSLIRKDNWREIVSDFSSFDTLQKKASENSASGIFSLSMSEMVASNLEKAYILAVIGLEEAVKEFYELIETLDTGPLKAKWKRKSPRIYETIEDLRNSMDYHEFGFPDDITYKNTMGAILELIHQRNAIVHRKKPTRSVSSQGWYSSLGWDKYVSRTTMERKALYERVCSAIKLSQALARLTESL